MIQTRRIIFVICIILIFTLTACGELERWEKIREESRAEEPLVEPTSEIVSDLPATLRYNDSEVTLESVDFYEIKSEHEYYLYIILKLDLSDLGEDQSYWLRKSDLDYNVYLTHEKNDYDFSSVGTLGRIFYTDTKEYYIGMTTATNLYHEGRYSYGGGKVTVSFEAKQDNKRTLWLDYHVELPEQLPSAEEIPEPMYSQMLKWINEYGK